MRLFVVALATALLAPCATLADQADAQASAVASDDAAAQDQQPQNAPPGEPQVQAQQSEPQVTCRNVRRRTESRLGSRRERMCTPVEAPAVAPGESQESSTAEGDAEPEGR